LNVYLNISCRTMLLFIACITVVCYAYRSFTHLLIGFILFYCCVHIIWPPTNIYLKCFLLTTSSHVPSPSIGLDILKGVSSATFFKMCFHLGGAHGMVVIKALRYKLKGRGFETRWGEWFLSSYLVFLAAPDPGVCSTSDRNEYQKPKDKISGE
jgi:hypothetical protein